MPIYNYICKDCELSYYVQHGFDDPPSKCPECESKNVKKNVKTLKKKDNIVLAPGSVVDKFIRDSKEDLRSQRDSLKGREK